MKHEYYLNFSKLHGLVACGGEDGAVECFDMRVRSSVGRIDAVGPSGDVDKVPFRLFLSSLSQLEFNFNNYALAVLTSLHYHPIRFHH